MDIPINNQRVGRGDETDLSVNGPERVYFFSELFLYHYIADVWLTQF